VLHKYFGEEVRDLIKHGEIPDNIKFNEAENTNEIEWIAVNILFMFIIA
jgi:hypothetical protein